MGPFNENDENVRGLFGPIGLLGLHDLFSETDLSVHSRFGLFDFAPKTSKDFITFLIYLVDRFYVLFIFTMTNSWIFGGFKHSKMKINAV